MESQDNMKKEINIGFDLDDILLDFNNAYRVHLNKKYNKDTKREDYYSIYSGDVFQLSEEEAESALDNFFFHNDHLTATTVDGSEEIVKRLSQKYNLEIITAKPDTLEEHTKTWLDKYFPDMFSIVHFANWFSKDKEKRKKSDICKERNISVFIDDSLETAIDISSIGIPVLLFDTPWNQTEALPKGVIRVFSWEEIEKEIYNLL